MCADKIDASYEVLGPWAEADPIPLKGLSTRLDNMAGKKIGLLCNNKRAAPIILDITERLLKERYPTAELSRFNSRSFSVSSLERDRKDEFDNWINSVDAVILSVGD